MWVMITLVIVYIASYKEAIELIGNNHASTAVHTISYDTVFIIGINERAS